MINYFLYCRKSTDVEDKQVLSIEAQLNELRALAQREGVNILETFIEKKSAKIPGRPLFNGMMNRIEKGEASGIVCWKLDRLARNPVDDGKIKWFLQTKVIHKIITPERIYRPEDNTLISAVEFGMANQFILDLSTNTKRGMREKVRRGEYPSLAPVGYINDSRTKTIVINRKKAHTIKQAYELYAQNNSRLEDISKFLAEQDFIGKRGKPLARDQVSAILSNPFYYGHFRYTGEVYEGRHEPIITKQLWDKVQDVLKGRSRTRINLYAPQPLCGLFRCGECNCMITGQDRLKRQKNGVTHRYIYYHCSKRGQPCSQPYIRGEELDKQLSELLSNYAMPPEWEKAWLDLAEKDKRESVNFTVGFVQELRSKIIDIDRKLQRLRDIYLDQDIEQEEYRKDKNNLMSEKKSLEEQIARFEQNRNSWFEPLINWIKDAQTLNAIAVGTSLLQKKQFAQKVFGLNLSLKDKKIDFTPQTQWASLREARVMALKKPSCFEMEPFSGIEPETFSLPWRCSTN
jgi:site-specific DNA recombinase